MIALLLALLPLPVEQTDFPENFRTSNMAVYIGCIRGEVKGGGDPGAPHIVRYSQVISLCGEERSRWANDLRGLIRARHPDWTPERVDTGVDFVISDFELEGLNFQHNFQDHAVHDLPPPRF
jgi:hypothetical protein